MIIDGIIKQLIQTKYEASISLATGNLCTFLNVFFQIDLDWIKYLPTLIGTAVPVIVAAWISWKNDKQKREHKEEMHTLDMIKELQKTGVIEPGTSREEIQKALRDFGAEIKITEDAT